jgi:16S rRNA (cytidine1402-2'-O)-methyltransferase
VLKSCDVIACEDTRVTKTLLSALDIKNKRLVSHHAHNTKESVEGLLNLLRQGHSIGLVSDAGTPGISDPGNKLAAACSTHLPPIVVHAVPGPCAIAAALSISGFDSSPFHFEGFLYSKSGKQRQQQLQRIAQTSEIVVVLYEAPHRLMQTLNELAAVDNGRGAKRPMALCRELTKVHEEVIYGTVREAQHWAEDLTRIQGKVRGEYVLVLGPQQQPKGSRISSSSDIEINNKVTVLLQELLDDGRARSEAVKIVCEMLGSSVSRGLVYKIALQMQWL